MWRCPAQAPSDVTEHAERWSRRLPQTTSTVSWRWPDLPPGSRVWHVVESKPGAAVVAFRPSGAGGAGEVATSLGEVIRLSDNVVLMSGRWSTGDGRRR
jgi:hypothetical protein